MLEWQKLLSDAPNPAERAVDDSVILAVAKKIMYNFNALHAVWNQRIDYFCIIIVLVDNLRSPKLDQSTLNYWDYSWIDAI